jgi:Family of unknown function (DUF7019)
VWGVGGSHSKAESISIALTKERPSMLSSWIQKLFGRSPESIPKKSHELKYFVYVSQTKVDMLFQQIPAKFLDGKKAEVGVDFGIVSAKIDGVMSGEEAKSLYRRALAVCDYLENQDQIGTLDSPKKYIAGDLLLKYGVVWEYAAEIAFFGTVHKGKKFGLIGSSGSLVGQHEKVATDHAAYYYTLKFLRQAVEFGTDKGQMDAVSSSEASEAIQMALTVLKSEPQQLSFVAKVLKIYDDSLLATPIFVAEAD